MNVLKVIAHAREKNIPQDPMLSIGNEVADQHAGEACKEMQGGARESAAEGKTTWGGARVRSRGVQGE